MEWHIEKCKGCVWEGMIASKRCLECEDGSNHMKPHALHPDINGFWERQAKALDGITANLLGVKGEIDRIKDGGKYPIVEE